MTQDDRPEGESVSKGPRRPRRALTAFVLVLSVLILATVPIWWAWGRAALDVGSLKRLQTSTDPVQGGGHRAPTLVPAEDAARGAWNERVHSGLLARFRQRPDPVPPVRLRVPAVGVDAPVVPVGIQRGDGSIDIPFDVSLVGWYRFSSQPGRPGSSVVVGHVDSRAQGAGAFFRLRDVMPGSAVVVRLADGTMHRFRVVARRQYRKEALPSRIYARSGRPVLTLVTCGGPFDQSTGHYMDNVVIFALPAAGDEGVS
jgi:hypothetical protein